MARKQQDVVQFGLLLLLSEMDVVARHARAVFWLM